MRGMTLEVYRTSGADCSLGGISATHDTLLVTHYVKDGMVRPLPEDMQVFGEWFEWPRVILEVTPQGWVRLVPAVSEGWGMAGGNYAGTSDSRWTDLLTALTGHHPVSSLVSIHDRFENFHGKGN